MSTRITPRVKTRLTLLTWDAHAFWEMFGNSGFFSFRFGRDLLLAQLKINKYLLNENIMLIVDRCT